MVFLLYQLPREPLKVKVDFTAGRESNEEFARRRGMPEIADMIANRDANDSKL